MPVDAEGAPAQEDTGLVDDNKKSAWWHRDEVFAAVEACLSAQDAAGESSTSDRRHMVNERYRHICLMMQSAGEWDCPRTPQESAVIRCVDVSICGKMAAKDTAVHHKYELVARECRNEVMGFYNDVMDEQPRGSGIRCIPTGKTVEEILDMIEEKCWHKWGGKAAQQNGPIKWKGGCCINFEVFKKYGPCNIGGQGQAFFLSDAREVGKTASGGCASRQKVRKDKLDDKVLKKARTALTTLSGTSSSGMPSVSTEAKEIMEKDVEVRRQEQARLRFETRSAALREALQLCERMQDEGMIRTATMQLIAHLQSNPEAQTSASPATPATVTASPATPATTTP
jgi:hypothetical protein